MWTAPDRAIDAAARAQGAPALASTAAGEWQTAAVAPNVLDRAFEARNPNHRWIADFIYIQSAEDWLYVAAVIDLFSRRVVA